MTWIDKRDNWITSGGRLQRPKEQARPKPRVVSALLRKRQTASCPACGETFPVEPEEWWTVAEISLALKLDRKTVYKLIDNMPPGAVYRVTGLGDHRVRDWAVQQLIEEM